MTVDDAPFQKKIKVFVLLGQSNMVGMGTVEGEETDGSLEHAVKTKKMYRYLVNDEDGAWKEIIDPHVRNIFTMGSGNGDGDIKKNEWLTVRNTKTIGPEIGIGCVLGKWMASKSCRDSDIGDSLDNDEIILLKSCIGNRSLGWDLLPPGSPSFEYTDKKTGKKWMYAGYKESPSRWEVGADPIPDDAWYAGVQYDGDIHRAKMVLANLSNHMPNTNTTTKTQCEYEVAGFLFWQGDKDRYDMAYASRYKENLARLIRNLRVEFASPNAKFVLATLGQTSKESDDSKPAGADRLIFNAQMEVSELAEFIGNTACVYSKPFCHGGASNGHYNHNAETYMDVGLEMGRALVNLLDDTGDKSSSSYV
mmetsp:Transcript_15347/g.31383  ORF Transcript_15347/g.31383 Transcript_15347/m.31383 type:complete len:364 (-) Transcript_15347:2710-3801(-)